MGICKCRKRTELFCWHCNKAVCYDCITDEEHALANVTTYIEFLEKFSQAPLVCPLSKKPIVNSNEVIRFMNMQIFDLQAIIEYGGRVIPGTNEPMLPPPEDNSKLANQIREKLSKIPWVAAELIKKTPTDQPSTQPQNVSTHSDPVATETAGAPIVESESLSKSDLKRKPPSSPPHSPPTNRAYDPPVSSHLSLPNAVAPRKTTVATNGNIANVVTSKSDEHTIDIPTRVPITDDDSEEKYKRRPIRRAFEALGLISPANTSTRTSSPYLINGWRLVLLLFLIATLIVVLFLSMNLDDEQKFIIQLKQDKP